MVEVRRNPPREITAATVLRIVLVVLATALAVLLIYELRRPLTYLFVAGFLSIALARPVAASQSNSYTARYDSPSSPR